MLREPELDVLLVATPVNVRYLTGFTGSNGLVLIGAGARASPVPIASSPTSATTRSRPIRSPMRSRARSSTDELLERRR